MRLFRAAAALALVLGVARADTAVPAAAPSFADARGTADAFVAAYLAGVTRAMRDRATVPFSSLVFLAPWRADHAAPLRAADPPTLDAVLAALAGDSLSRKMLRERFPGDRAWRLVDAKRPDEVHPCGEQRAGQTCVALCGRAYTCIYVGVHATPRGARVDAFVAAEIPPT